jgi:Zn-dependent protease with chaperone function
MNSASPPVLERWPSELPLRILVILASLAIWALLALSLIGLIYVAFIVLFLFATHLVFITHIRGSAVRLGPGQFPQLWQRVVELSQAAGLEAPPEAYLMEAGGSLNAFATKFFRGRLMVLYSDLLEACVDDPRARDMIIGHELAHIKAGHLDWFVVTAPGRLIPFLGTAYSRACELTCDRWGAVLCGEVEAAHRGLAILAAGATFGPKVRLDAFVAQRADLDTGWMTLGKWLSSYPPLSERVAALTPEQFAELPTATGRGALRAALLLGAVVTLPTLATVAMVALWTTKIVPLLGTAGLDTTSSSAYESSHLVEDPAAAAAQVQLDLDQLAELVRTHHRSAGEVVLDGDRLEELWAQQRPDDDFPTDPFDGLDYGFVALSTSEVMLFSSGPDQEASTDDDLEVVVRLES